MRFKRLFSAFALAWAAAVAVVSDIFLISACRQLALDTDKTASLFPMIIVPLCFAAADCGLVMYFSKLLVRRLRKKYISLPANTEYPFFRNYVLILAIAAAGNTVLLYTRFRSVLTILEKEEDRRLHLLCSSQPDYLVTRLEALSGRLSLYHTAAVIMLVLLIIIKTAGCFYIARSLIKTYHKHPASAYN